MAIVYRNQRRISARVAAACGAVVASVGLWAAPAHAQPANDECVNATVIPSSTPVPVFTDSVDTTAATSNPADPPLSCNGSGAQTDGNTVWYAWTPASDVTVNLSTRGSIRVNGLALDTAHGVYTGSCDALVEVACVDIGLNDDLFFDAEAGQTYYIKFGEFLDGVGGGTLEVTVEPPPPPQQIILESVADGVSAPIRDLVAFPTVSPLARQGLAPLVDVPMIEVPGPFGVLNNARRSRSVPLNANFARPDPLVTGTKPGPGKPGIGIEQVFDGVENDDNALISGGFVAPPDTIGDVGRDHYVQMSNNVTEIFDKNGNTVLGPFQNNVFWSGLGGLCETTNRGDPIIMYDEQRDRWFVSQFAFNAGPASLCVAVSASGDPTGAYYQHEFDFGDIGFPDYPKYGFVTDGVTVMVNLFSPFQGAGLGVIDKKEAFSAEQTTMVFFVLGAQEFGFVPADNDGPFFRRTKPTFFTNNGGSGDRIDVWEIDADYRNPTNSTIGEVARIPVTPFDADLCPAFRETCIAQPGSGTGIFPENIPFLEAISDRMMHRAQIRHFQGAQFALLSHTVDADGAGAAGVRWYLLRKNRRRGWFLVEESTFAPDGDSRWMGSVAMNQRSEICMGYSISSQETFPSVGVACVRGVFDGDDDDDEGPGFSIVESVAFDGNVDGNVQRQTARWGDYSSLSVDPVDDSFWFTTEIAEPNQLLGPPVNPERFGWGTKIVQFEAVDSSDDDDDEED